MAMTTATGEWTYEDLLDLPEDKRYEIIDGVLYEMPSPNSDHAISVMGIITELHPSVSQRGGRVLTAPLDVFLPGANPVQPDVIVLLPESLYLVSKRGIEGAPDIIIEVLSPSNPEHDRNRKRALYTHAGVREYWLASPEAAIIEVLALRDGAYIVHARAGGDEPVTSTVLTELSFPASAVFS